MTRHPERSSRDRGAIYAVLDEGLVAHVAALVDGTLTVVPMSFGRSGDTLILHGARTGRLMRALAGGADVCVAVTLLDGIVVARSAFHSSMNYRSVVAYGRSRPIEGDDERRAALDLLTDHILPGRTREVRETTAAELAGTQVIAVPMEEASVKVRSGPPAEPDDDSSLPIWAGTIPLALTASPPEPAATVDGEVALPGSVAAFGTRRSG